MNDTMTHKIHTSTACIGHFIDTTIYETYLGELWSGIPYAMRDKADDEIGKCAVDYLNDAFWTDVFPSDYDDDFEVTYTGTYHPKFYNFETDSVLLYGDVESILDDDLSLYHMNSESCAVPDIPEHEC